LLLQVTQTAVKQLYLTISPVRIEHVGNWPGVTIAKKEGDIEKGA
jgi:Fe2+ transport system protein B